MSTRALEARPIRDGGVRLFGGETATDTGNRRLDQLVQRAAALAERGEAVGEVGSVLAVVGKCSVIVILSTEGDAEERARAMLDADGGPGRPAGHRRPRR